MDSTLINSTTLPTFGETEKTRRIKFGLFIFLEPPALVCNLILIYYLIADRTLRHTIHYHSILVLLIITLLTNLVELPRIIHYLHVGMVVPHSDLNCLFWQWCDYFLFSSANLYMFWLSFERYLLIFHGSLYTTVKRRLLFHYLPMVVILVYAFCWYTVVVFIYPCKRQFDFSQPLCGFPCYTTHANVSLYDLIAHTGLPLAASMVLDTSLIIRVLYRKRVGLQHQGGQWYRYRKMIIQLLTISSLYLSNQLPFTTVVFLQLFINLPDWLGHIQVVYLYYLFWLLTLLLPLGCIGCMTEIASKLKITLTRQKRKISMMAPITIDRPRNRLSVR